ncbi:MAG TPA: DUF3822 family protein [Lutibacter sp.]|nr:DUF3822 family protein [Lutibacter sp.]
MIQVKNQAQSNLVDNITYDTCHLSIQLSLNGLVYCIFDKELIDVVLLKEYQFEKRAQTPELLLEYVKEIFESDSELTQNYESVNVTHKNSLATIVPESLYDKDHHSDFLKYSVKVLKSDFISVDNMSESESKNIYIPFKFINDYLEKKHQGFKYSHASSLLVTSLLKYQKHSLNKYFFVNVSKNIIDVVYLANNKLHLYNSFLFYTKEDFLYYILFSLEQLQLNPNEQKITFLGAIDKKSPLFDITYTYVRNIDFLNVENHSLSEEFYEMNPHIEKHHYFELLNQF